MAGIGEASLVLGLISSIIAICEGAHEIYEAASNVKSLPRKFQLAAEQIPLVLHILALAEQNIQAKAVSQDGLQSAMPILERCKESATALKDIFDKTIPPKDASRTERYKKAVGIKLKSNKVKEYMEEVIKSMELLAQNQVFQDAETLEDIKEAIEQLSNISDEEEQSRYAVVGGQMNVLTGPGTQKNQSMIGDNNNQYNAKIQNFGGNQGKYSS